ncbi:MAG TPA: bacillithiol system redox-active protein YtxJ [Balneolaceae bacterium]|nr:bacillithiol system redox-active protein YtxJ [Balneolaceae bacterium]
MKTTLSSTGIVLDDWNILTDKEDFKQVLSASKSRPQLVYKHSHRCSICFLARKEIENSFDEISKLADMNFVNVIKNREVSNLIAKESGVRHESPQALILQDRDVVWHESHQAIKSEQIMKILQV